MSSTLCATAVPFSAASSTLQPITVPECHGDQSTNRKKRRLLVFKVWAQRGQTDGAPDRLKRGTSWDLEINPDVWA
ncbi:hypothetical protein EYF80_016278 [Liparis tanakae]|uniref:Uncharacterized protein n=1 Tax=Liparis tanakae TaxID=230148 RepID=A0A4Z2I6B6_9TELE|nr:hypothetical protein EYF80_016278 [Liparis tanakae]